jgi:hypothetical protein
MKAILSLAVILLGHFAPVSAQTPTSGENSRQAAQKVVRETEKWHQDKEQDRQRYSRQGIGLSNRQAIPFKLPLNKEQKRRLATDAAILSGYSDFLKQSRTGLIKLFPDLGCADAYVVRADDKCLNWIPNSAFYSFREKEHTTVYLSDLIYKNGFFVTDGILSQGILVALGDVPLEEVSLASEGANFLLNYKPEPNSMDAFKQFIQISRGVKDGKFEYRKAVPAIENTTYMIRVIAYKGHFYTVYRGWGFDMLYDDNRIDTTLAFRVLRKAEDESITILWKELTRKESPRIVFPKKEKKKDSKSANNRG